MKLAPGVAHNNFHHLRFCIESINGGKISLLNFSGSSSSLMIEKKTLAGSPQFGPGGLIPRKLLACEFNKSVHFYKYKHCSAVVNGGLIEK